MYKYFIILAILFATTSCDRFHNKTIEPAEGEILLAKVGDDMLYLSKIPAFNFAGLNAEDSIVLLNKYVEQWILDELTVLKAEESLGNLDRIEQETYRYRNDLIKASYQKKIMETSDLTVSEEEMRNYYNKHKEYFKFDENHYEIKYIILPKKISNLQQIRKTISEGKSSNFLTSYCIGNPEKCQIKESAIKDELFLSSLLKIPESALKVSGGYKYQYIDDENVMIYNILAVKNKGDIAPLELVKKEVGVMTLYNKQQEYLLELEEKTYQKAKDDKIFENYIN